MQSLIHFYWHYSGLFLVIYTWCLLAFPHLVGLKIKKHKNIRVFSDFAALPEYGMVMNPIIILIGITQILFLSYILHRFSISILGGGTLYLFGSLNLIVCGFFNNRSYSKLHKLASRLYFIFGLIGALFLSIKIGIILTLIVVCLLVGLTYLHFRGKDIHAELWVAIMSTLWGVAIYLI